MNDHPLDPCCHLVALYNDKCFASMPFGFRARCCNDNVQYFLHTRYLERTRCNMPRQLCARYHFSLRTALRTVSCIDQIMNLKYPLSSCLFRGPFKCLRNAMRGGEVSDFAENSMTKVYGSTLLAL